MNEYDDTGNRIAQPNEPPARIYLQWYGSGAGEWPETDYGDDVTWCETRIYDGDICYIRAGKRTAELIRRIEAGEAGRDDAITRRPADEPIL